MIKRILLIFTACLVPAAMTAQWTKEDSIQLHRALNSKDGIRLNQETMKAISEGTLINIGKPIGQPLAAPLELPVNRTFDNLPTPENISLWLNPDLDPYLYFKYYFKFADTTSITDKTIPGFDLTGVNLRKSSLFRAGAFELGVPNEPHQTTVNFARITFDANDMLSRVFSPTYRRRMYNRQHANAWKTYNDISPRRQTTPVDTVLPLPSVE